MEQTYKYGYGHLRKKNKEEKIRNKEVEQTYKYGYGYLQEEK